MLFFVILNAVEYFWHTQSTKYTKDNKIQFCITEIMQWLREAKPRFNCVDHIRPSHGIVEADAASFSVSRPECGLQWFSCWLIAFYLLKHKT